jgi:hypothetical protein
MGKGSTRRPQSVPREKFNKNWDAIFPTKPKGEKNNDNNQSK